MMWYSMTFLVTLLFMESASLLEPVPGKPPQSVHGYFIDRVPLGVLLNAMEQHFRVHANGQLNYRPIIGILTEEYYPDKVNNSTNGSYIAASYVKMVEASGARVVPILIGQNTSYYTNMVKTVNGILMPGGGLDLWAKGGYGEAAKIIYEKSLEINNNGTMFPVFGVCLGMEVLAVVTANMSRDLLTAIKGTDNIPLPLEFKPGYTTSLLFNLASGYIISLLSTKPITANHHSKCLTEESFIQHHIEDTWNILTTSKVEGGLEFISTMEHAQHPQIFGTQFHPEKVVFEWNIRSTDPHTREAITANRYFYDHFVQLARQNQNHFSNEEEEKSSLIYNYKPDFTDSYFEQIYRFQYS